MGQKRNPKIEALCEKFVTLRTEWKAAGRPMSTAKDLLEAAMIEARLESYEFDSKTISFKGEKKLVVKENKEQSNGEAT